MRGKRTDVATIAKILEAKINTNAQWSEIARDLWIPERTVNHILDTEFAEICWNNTAVSDLMVRNDNLQCLADVLIAEMIENKHDSVTIAQLTSLRTSTFTQNQLIKWKPTDIKKVDMDFSSMTPEEIDQEIKNLIS